MLSVFENFMRKSRYSILIAVFTSILSSILLFIFTLVKFIISILDIKELSSKELVINMIETIDIFLLGIISLIFGWSIYELYIRDPNKNWDKKDRISSSLIVYSLDELKEKLSKLVIIMLIITFFKYALYFEYEDIYQLLIFSISIFFISLGIYFTRDKV